MAHQKNQVEPLIALPKSPVLRADTFANVRNEAGLTFEDWLFSPS